MEITYVPIDTVKPAEYNPRQMTEKQAQDLKNSIQEFGLVDPLIVNKYKGREMVLVGGHQRLNVAKSLGFTEVPIVFVDLDEIKEKKLNLRLNKNLGEWDWDKMANFEIDILKEIGFNDVELNDGLSLELGVVEDEAPEPRPDPNVKLGDLFQLGNHQLLCGDATKKEDVLRLMDGQKADMVFTDPPYSVNFTKKAKEVLHSKGNTAIENDDMSTKDTADKIWSPAFRNMYEMATDECSCYVTMPQGGDQMMMMMMMMNENWQVKHELIWVKEAPVFSMGRLDYDYKHEPILYGWKKSHKFYGAGNFTKSVWEIARKENKLHPTMKPIELIANCLANSTLDNQNVLDLFGGSGSTLIACEQLNRKCYMMEIDPQYVRVIIDRWEALTKQKAILLNGHD